MKKTLALLLAVVLCLSVFAACKPAEPAPSGNASKPAEDSSVAEEKLNFHKEGYPVFDDLTTYKIHCLKWPTHIDYNEMEIFKTHEKTTNLHVEWTMMPNESIKEKKQLLFASRDNLPDAVWGQVYSNDEILNFASQGLIIPLNDLIEKYGPNIKKAMEECPELKAAMVAPDGNIYTLAGGANPMRSHMPVNNKMWINQVWLDKLGMKVPTSIDELYQVLKAMKGKDLNGNGEDDEIPFTIEPVMIERFMTPWGITGPTVVKNGKVSSAYLDPGFREGLRWLNKLYKEGLMDVEVFTQTLAQFRSKGNGPELRYGFFPRLADFQIVGLKNEPFYEPVPALKGPAGQQIVVDGTNSIVSNKFLITKNCKDPGALIRWVDYFYTEIGNLEVGRAPKDIGYKVNEDGTYKILNTPEEWNGKVPGGTSPSYGSTKIFPNDRDIILNEINEKCYIPYAMKEFFPSKIFYTAEETEIRMQYLTSVHDYAEQSIAQFVTGVLDINSDKDYNTFVTEMKNIGVEELVKTDQAAYDRYLEATK